MLLSPHSLLPINIAVFRSGRGTDFRPALALGTADSDSNNINNSSNKKSTITAVEGEGPCGGGETLHTTVVSGNDELGGEAKSSPSIMELFDTNDVVAAAREQAAARDSNKTATAAAAGAPEASPAAAMARRHSLGRGRSKRFSTDSLRPSSGAWDHRNGLPAHKKAASFSGGVPRAGRGSGGSVGGAERHGYLSFSEVQVRRMEGLGGPGGERKTAKLAYTGETRYRPLALRSRIQTAKRHPQTPRHPSLHFYFEVIHLFLSRSRLFVVGCSCCFFFFIRCFVKLN